MALLNDTAQRIDREPVLFLGCSGPELMALAFIGGLMGALFSALVGGVFFGVWFLIMPSFFLCSFVTVWKGGKFLQKHKEGKPDGYYGKLLRYHLSGKIIPSKFIKRSGFWSVRK